MLLYLKLIFEFVSSVLVIVIELQATVPTFVTDSLVSRDFGAMRLDYVMTNDRATELHRSFMESLGPSSESEAPSCGPVRDLETARSSPRFPLIFDMDF